MEDFKWFFARLFSPMERIECAFIDCVNHREVNRYRDKQGRHWLAHGSRAMFRVPV